MTVSNTRLAIDSSLSPQEKDLVQPRRPRAHRGAGSAHLDHADGSTQVADKPGTNPNFDPGRTYFEVTPFNAPAALVGASVKLSIAVQSTQGEVLAVPVNALSIGADGRERVQVDRGGGRTELVYVRTGLRAQGFVEVSPRKAGALKEGDLVVIGSARRRRGGEGADRLRRAGDARRRRARRRAPRRRRARRGERRRGRRRRGTAPAATADDAHDDDRDARRRRRRRREPGGDEQRRRAGNLPWTVTRPAARSPAPQPRPRGGLAVLPRPPVVELRNVSRTYGADPPVPGAARRRPRRRARRRDRDRRPVGLGQVDAAEHRRLPGPADRRALPASTAPTSPSSTRTSSPRCAGGCWASSFRRSTCSPTAR